MERMGLIRNVTIFQKEGSKRQLWHSTQIDKITFGCNGIIHSSDFYSHEHSLLFSFYSILTGHLLDLCEFWCESGFSHYAITSKENICVSNCCGQWDLH